VNGFPAGRARGDLTLAGFVAAAIVALLLAGALAWLSRQQEAAAAWVAHSQEVLASLARARAALLEAQGGARAYVISGRAEDVEGFARGRAALDAEVGRLRALVADNGSRQAQVDELRGALRERVATLERTVDARREGGFDAARAIVDSELPRHEAAAVRNFFTRLEDEEQRLLRLRLAEHQSRLRGFRASTAAIVAALVAMLAFLYTRVRRRRTEQDRLLEAEQRFHRMTESVVDYAIIMLDTAGRVVSWNAGAERIKRYREEEIVGRDFACFYLPEDIAAGKPAHGLRTASEQGHYEAEGWRVRRDGSRFWARVSIAPLRDAQGAVRGFVKVTRDLTERKAAEEALLAEVRERRRIDQQLHRLNESLDRIVADRTSELRETNAGLVDAKQRLEQLSLRFITAQEDERRRVARELHEEIGQALGAIRLRLGVALNDEARRARPLEESAAIADEAIARIRSLAVNLRPPMLDDLGLADALQWALGQQSKAAGWTSAMRADELPQRLPPDIETACFRIGQEALINAARHANARHVEVTLQSAGPELRLTVADDGDGFEFDRPDGARGYVGLLAMSERASLVGGRLDIESAPGKGTRVRASFPLVAAGG
jgi:PAS domain S-box-containing protein